MAFPGRRSLARIAALLLACAGPAGAAQLEESPATRRATAHYDAGTRAMSRERYQEAADEFEKAVALDPRLVLPYYGLGQARMALKDYTAAVHAYLRCRQAFHDEVKRLVDQQSSREQSRNEDVRAIEDQMAVTSSGAPGSGGSPSSFDRSNATNMQQRLDLLRTQRDRVSAADRRTPPWISVALAGAYFRSDSLADAEREYKAALEVDPNVGEAHNNLAVVYLLTNRVDDAEREVALAEKAGIRVPEGLKRDIAKARSSPAPR